MDPTVEHVLERSRRVYEDVEPVEGETNTKDILVKAMDGLREQHKILSALFETYPLLEYAGTFWLRHADQGMTSFVLADHPWILNDKSKVFTIWRNLNSIEGGLLFHVLGDLGLSDLEHQTPDRSPANMVQIAAYLDLRNLLNGMLGVFSDANYYHQALTAAACEGNEALVRAFILNERASRAPGPLTALIAASSTRHVATVEFLLEFLKRPQHVSYQICTTISTIGACLSSTEAMLYAVYRICREQNDTWFDYEMIKIIVASTRSHRDNLDNRVLESLDEMNLAVEEVFKLKGWSPIMIASIHGNELTIPLLMSQTNKTLEGLAPVECALFIAGVFGHEKFVRELLHRAPATLPRRRALYLAVLLGLEPIIDVLVTEALPEQIVRIPNRDGPETVAGKVAGSGIVSTMKLLVSKGFDLFIVDAKGKTPLHHAVESRHDGMVKYLLQIIPLEAIGVKDADGLTALDFASKNGLSHLTRLWDEPPFQDQGASRKRKFSS
jgi:ankyrin repeat protein